MPRPRKPTALHLITGALAHDPQRFRDRLNEPTPELGIGEPPKWLDRHSKTIWKELQAEIAPCVLTRQDRQMLAALCCLLAQFRTSPGNMPTARLAQMNSMLGQFGMSPAARSKVTAARGSKPGNKFDNNGVKPQSVPPNNPTTRRSK